MARGAWLFFFLLWSPLVHAQGTSLLKNYEPLRQLIPSSDLSGLAQEIQKQNPKLFQTFFLQASYFEGLKDLRCDKTRHSFPFSWYQLGQGYYGLALTAPNQQRWEDFLLYAEVAYLEGIHQTPSCSLNYLGLGEAFLLAGKPAEAVIFFVELLKDAPNQEISRRTLVGKGFSDALIGKPALARKALKKVLGWGGWNTASFYYFLAQSDFVARDIKATEENINRAIELSKNPVAKIVDPFPISFETILYLKKIIQ